MKFYHIINTKRGSGITVVAKIVETQNDSNNPEKDLPYTVECGVSYCAPVEANFSRPRGRIIASSRLTNSKAMPLFKRFSFTTNGRDGLKTKVLSCLKEVLPINWARALVDRELERLQAVSLHRILEETAL